MTSEKIIDTTKRDVLTDKEISDRIDKIILVERVRGPEEAELVLREIDRIHSAGQVAIEDRQKMDKLYWILLVSLNPPERDLFTEKMNKSFGMKRLTEEIPEIRKLFASRGEKNETNIA